MLACHARERRSLLLGGAQYLLSSFIGRTPACHAEERGSIPRGSADQNFLTNRKLDYGIIAYIEVLMSPEALRDSPLHRVEIKPIPSTLNDAVASLDGMLSDEAKAYLRDGGAQAASDMHHSLGRYLRNKWGLWADSELAQYMRDVEKVEHPDDMSHAILVAYCNSLVK